MRGAHSRKQCHLSLVIWFGTSIDWMAGCSWPSRCKLERKSKSIFLVDNGIWTVSNYWSGYRWQWELFIWSRGLRLIFLKGTARWSFLLPQFPSSRIPGSHMDGYCVLGGVLDSITWMPSSWTKHQLVCCSHQFLASRKVFLVPIASLSNLVWKPPGGRLVKGRVWGGGMQWTPYKQAPLWQSSRIHHFVGRWYNRGILHGIAVNIPCSIWFWEVYRYEEPWTAASRIGP